MSQGNGGAIQPTPPHKTSLPGVVETPLGSDSVVDHRPRPTWSEISEVGVGLTGPSSGSWPQARSTGQDGRRTGAAAEPQPRRAHVRRRQGHRQGHRQAQELCGPSALPRPPRPLRAHSAGRAPSVGGGPGAWLVGSSVPCLLPSRPPMHHPWAGSWRHPEESAPQPEAGCSVGFALWWGVEVGGLPQGSGVRVRAGSRHWALPGQASKSSSLPVLRSTG